MGLLAWLQKLRIGVTNETAGNSLRAALYQLGNSPANDSNNFALKLYEHLAQPSQNLILSPVSIRAAVMMAQAGAKGDTATQMEETLCMSSADQAEHVAFAELLARTNAAAGTKCDLILENSLWSQRGAPLQASYVELIERHYAASINAVDFCNALDATRAAINRWVRDKTRERIVELIDQDLNPLSRLVLVNAAYLKAKWDLPFRRSETCDETFYLENGRTVKTPLMHQRHEVGYMCGRGFQAVELEYVGHNFSMLLVLPDRKDGLPQLEHRFSPQMLADCIDAMIFRTTILVLPRFRFSWGTNVANLLMQLGMPLAFSEDADFSGINGLTPPDPEALRISEVLHKAFVEADEEGTEAAAATAVLMTHTGMAVRSEPPATFRADHPFLFAIRERATGLIVFLGRVANPTSHG